MDYKYKYDKYKNKYFFLKNYLESHIIKKKLNAIFMLCFLKDHYVLGACISAFTHKQFIRKLNLEIELVILCDGYIYKKYHNLLQVYFDRVIEIKLRQFSLNKDYNFCKKYNEWMCYSLTKWECLKYEEYDKILFIDIDILPLKDKFYNLFSFNTPAFHNIDIKKKCINNTAYNNFINFSYKEYIQRYQLINIGTIDGGLCLLKPSKETFNEYIKFTQNIYKNGIYSKEKTGPDETSLFYFFSKKNINLYDICNDYSFIPWDHELENIKNAKAINYLALVKPWRKTLFLAWPEEIIWRDIYKKMPHNKSLDLLFRNTLIDYLKEYKNMNNYRKKKFNNQDFIKKNKKKYDINSNITYQNILSLESDIFFRDYGALNKYKINSINDITK